MPVNLTSQYCYFFEESAFVATDRPGFRRRIITGSGLQLWFWRITGGATGSVIHRHEDTEQLGIIVRGALDFRIGEKDDPSRVTLAAGDVYLVPVGVWHGDSKFIGDDELNEVWILDVFSPPRKER
jgi:mannose-6-phosphate isomerase-like protein (cupin superfamily)